MGQIILQILLALGSPFFERLAIMIGGADITFGKPIPDTHAIVFSQQEYEEKDLVIVSEPGTISYKYLDVMRKRGLVKDNFNSGYFLCIPVVNKQKSRIENSKAKNVRAKIFFYDFNWNIVGNKDGYVGRWQKSVQPYDYKYVDSLKFMDISAGETCNLDIAMQPVTEKSWLAWNNESYLAVDYEENKLFVDGFIFEVVINGDNFFEKRKTYKFFREKQSGEPKFIEVHKPAT